MENARGLFTVRIFFFFYNGQRSHTFFVTSAPKKKKKITKYVFYYHVSNEFLFFRFSSFSFFPFFFFSFFLSPLNQSVFNFVFNPPRIFSRFFFSSSHFFLYIYISLVSSSNSSSPFDTYYDVLFCFLSVLQFFHSLFIIFFFFFGFVFFVFLFFFSFISFFFFLSSLLALCSSSRTTLNGLEARLLAVPDLDRHTSPIRTGTRNTRSGPLICGFETVSRGRRTLRWAGPVVKLNFAKCLGHQLWRVVRVNIVRRFHPHGQLRVTLVLPFPSSRYCLKIGQSSIGSKGEKSWRIFFCSNFKTFYYFSNYYYYYYCRAKARWTPVT